MAKPILTAEDQEIYNTVLTDQQRRAIDADIADVRYYKQKKKYLLIALVGCILAMLIFL